MSIADSCPCGSGSAFTDCCGPIIGGSHGADTAEMLMRSRYSAHVLGDVAYLRASWHSATRPAVVDIGEPVQWLGLKVVATHDGGKTDSEGTVEFVARYKIAGRAFRLHEISRFVREADHWTYFSGTPGRSDSRAKAAKS
jgi:SEC-C motif-containing protein